MKTSGEFLIFLLLLITNGRVFFVEQRKDSIVLLSPLAFFLSIFQIMSWGFDLFTGTAFILALFVLLSNFHALYRYFERLYVDHYTPVMYIWAISTTLVSIAALAFLIYFAPSTPLTTRNLRESPNPINYSSERYTGSFRSGFEKASALQKTNLTIYEISPATQNSEQSRPVIVFFPDKRAQTYHYLPYLFKMAQNGFTIFSADFNAKDCRWLHNVFDSRAFRRFGMITASLSNPFKFDSQREFYTFNSSLECEVMFKILEEKFSPQTQYILASDFMANTAISDFQKSHQNQIAGFFYLDELAAAGGYKTPGYGFVAYTDPLVATILKVERDRAGEEPNVCAQKTIEIINAIKSEEEKNDTESAE